MALVKTGYKAVLQIKSGHGLFPKKLKILSRMHQVVFR
jgi:hypothetical protein